jgi:putative FmdB family regulatory protein
MPIFEYRCKECGHVTEFLEASGSNDSHACEECGGKKTEKAFSAFAARMAPSRAPQPAARCDSCQSRGTCPMA